MGVFGPLSKFFFKFDRFDVENLVSSHYLPRLYQPQSIAMVNECNKTIVKLLIAVQARCTRLALVGLSQSSKSPK